MGVLQPLFSVRMEPVLLHPRWSRCNKQSFAEARSQCPWGSTLFLLGLGERACELLCALACHLAVICVGTSGASQFLSAGLGGREVRGRAAIDKRKQASSHLCTCTKHLGTRNKCLTAPTEAPLQRGEQQVHAGWMQRALRWECCNLCSAFAWSPCFCIPIWSRCNKQSFAEARSQCP